ncbi:MAG: EAL domain-containing protein [Gammaproteobacteria bacterium]|nr:EAL domain-containing protein [Gammaproteobacteria bacterium]MBU1732145.1 EAL domain-containing protein [Gammaproteobacteria bacterium]MBU1893325.1 EAL domain-containing protein [Gammaproteobacteria bacterium]
MPQPDKTSRKSNQPNGSTGARLPHIHLSRWPYALAIVWTIAIAASLYWNYRQTHTLLLEQAHSELRANFFKDLAFRQWATRHGGVYVPVNQETQPDPFVAYLPERDIVTPSGRILTLINPALMVRQFNEMAQQNYGAISHISSLRPLNPVNQPDPWEAQALKTLAGGVEEITDIALINNAAYLRLIRPMVMVEACLDCHKQQGYRAGEQAGGVSVSVPLAPLEAAEKERMVSVGLGHGILWLLGLSGIGFGARQLGRRITERESVYFALQESEDRSRSILSTSLDAIITIDGEERITGWNQQAETIFGWNVEEVMGAPLSGKIIPPRQREAHLRGIKRLLESGRGSFINRRIEVTGLRRNGEEFPLELAIAFFVTEGKPAFSAFLRDISESKRNEEKIQRDFYLQQALAAALEISIRPIPFTERLENALSSILATPWLALRGTGAIFLVAEDDKTLLLAAQQGVVEPILQQCASVPFGECMCGLAAKEKMPIFASEVDERHTRSYPGMLPHGHYCLPILSGERLLGVLNLYLEKGHQKNEAELHFLSAVAHVLGGMIQRHHAEEQLQHSAYYDALTGMPNRALLLERLDRCLKRAVRHHEFRYAVLFLDLDRFKNINDSLGHASGDQVLVTVAARLQQCIRPGDTVARLGGDEFAILLDDIVDILDASQVAERIHASMLKPFEFFSHEAFISTSIGITLGNPAYKTPQDLLRDADTAMYRAKSQGAAKTAIFDEQMHDHVVALVTMETELRRAVERNELCVYYQPIVSSTSGEAIGFEALVRWQHPERGMISPAEFIPVAEESGLIGSIGRWVLQEACREAQTWRSRFPHGDGLFVSVNLSAKQFLQANLGEEILQILLESGLDPHRLHLEITESALLDNPETSNQVLVELRARGIHLYLDDFGTGYSSLSYLHSFPFDALKIDRSFVCMLGKGSKHVGMVSAIIAIARSFGMDVIAEGVETREQLEQLWELGCHNIQGYYYSRPLPVEGVTEWLAKG